MRRPILGSYLSLLLGSAADHRHLSATSRLRRESVVVGNLILHQLLHVISAASVDSLRVALVGVVAVFAGAGVTVGVGDGIVALLLHLLIEFVESRGLLEGRVRALGGLFVDG